MKRVFLLLTVMLGLATMANAQEVGKYWVGGSLGFTAVDGDGSTDYNYKIVPEFGYVLSDKLGIGVKLGYQHLENGTGTLIGEAISANGTGDIDILSINPFLRISCIKGNIGGLFVDAGAGYSHVKNEFNVLESYATIKQKANIVEVGFRPGVALNVSDKVALTAKFGFLGWQHGWGDISTTNKYGFDFNLDQALLGVNFVF